MSVVIVSGLLTTMLVVAVLFPVAFSILFDNTNNGSSNSVYYSVTSSGSIQVFDQNFLTIFGEYPLGNLVGKTVNTWKIPLARDAGIFQPESQIQFRVYDKSELINNQLLVVKQVIGDINPSDIPATKTWYNFTTSDYILTDDDYIAMECVVCGVDAVTLQLYFVTDNPTNGFMATFNENHFGIDYPTSDINMILSGTSTPTVDYSILRLLPLLGGVGVMLIVFRYYIMVNKG